MHDEYVKLIHGGGGEVMVNFIESLFVKSFGDGRILNGVGLKDLDDGASIPLGEWEIVLTSDGYTVDPIFFPGGDIGKLAISGTINDLAVMGAKPLAILDDLIVEEGFSINDLKKVINSMSLTAKEIGVTIMGGDFKVMPKGRIDKLIITTTGIGLTRRGKVITDSGLRPGDKIIVTGTIGEHEIALISVREGIEFETEIVSDVAPIWPIMNKALKIGGITAAKDPTRGGLAAALNELAKKSNVGIIIHENKIPIRDEVRAASEMLGLDPLYLACEGRAIIGVKPEKAEEVLEAIRSIHLGKNATIIGQVVKENPGFVVLETMVGGRRIIEPPIGTPLPRVC
ncbi:MAG: hydrogenase expression/formation protein HypE [Candidatus Methanomethylicota archaeon]|uniref:Hydrogenase expression/formation protein HypE n=1 Tax=Thermoproteota archaeon TaxID=2056631 RepID=A0A497EW82_9CREN|nr:MAG: hydrogenase expression/formation protein HypE [Candidatus Verstraetearchaeota archaeon]